MMIAICTATSMMMMKLLMMMMIVVVVAVVVVVVAAAAEAATVVVVVEMMMMAATMMRWRRKRTMNGNAQKVKKQGRLSRKSTSVSHTQKHLLVTRAGIPHGLKPNSTYQGGA